MTEVISSDKFTCSCLDYVASWVCLYHIVTNFFFFFEIAFLVSWWDFETFSFWSRCHGYIVLFIGSLQLMIFCTSPPVLRCLLCYWLYFNLSDWLIFIVYIRCIYCSSRKLGSLQILFWGSSIMLVPSLQQTPHLVKEARESLLRHLTDVLGNDGVAAHYMLLHLLSRVTGFLLCSWFHFYFMHGDSYYFCSLHIFHTDISLPHIWCL